MKVVKVAAAVICDPPAEKKRIFATARGYGEYKGWWEFPGGKVEAGETPQEALVREIKEELDTDIEVGQLIGTIEYDYPDFHLSMDCFWCGIREGSLVLKEAQEARWLTTAHRIKYQGSGRTGSPGWKTCQERPSLSKRFALLF